LLERLQISRDQLKSVLDTIQRGLDPDTLINQLQSQKSGASPIKMEPTKTARFALSKVCEQMTDKTDPMAVSEAIPVILRIVPTANETMAYHYDEQRLTYFDDGNYKTLFFNQIVSEHLTDLDPRISELVESAF